MFRLPPKVSRTRCTLARELTLAEHAGTCYAMKSSCTRAEAEYGLVGAFARGSFLCLADDAAGFAVELGISVRTLALRRARVLLSFCARGAGVYCMALGVVKWFDAKKGFGFILGPDKGRDIFVHYTSIESEGFRALKDGDKVEFELAETTKGLQAKNVRPVGEDPT